MTKSEIIAVMADQADISAAAATRTLDAMLGAIRQSLQDGEPVRLAGFGTFEVRERSARTGRNPQTGEAVAIAAAKVPAFKPAKALRSALN